MLMQFLHVDAIFTAFMRFLHVHVIFTCPCNFYSRGGLSIESALLKRNITCNSQVHLCVCVCVCVCVCFGGT